MDQKYLAYGGFTILGVLLIAGIVFSYTGTTSVSGLAVAPGGYAWYIPGYVSEPNGNHDAILPQIQSDDNVWNSDWIVCDENGLGGNPMNVTFSSNAPLDVNSGSWILSFESKFAWADAILSLSCYDANHKQVYFKLNWLPPEGINNIDLSRYCAWEQNKYDPTAYDLTVTFERKGSNCLKFDYIWIGRKQ